MSGAMLHHKVGDPIDFDELLTRIPAIRQSLLSSFDDCSLSTLLSMKYGEGWSTHPQGRGTLFHRFAAEALRTMQLQDETTIPTSEAFEIFYEVLRQVDVPEDEVVRVPLRELRELRMSVAKWAKDNEFNVRAIVDIEKRLAATIKYPDENGEVVERVLTGQLDVLMSEPPDGAIVIDWKDTWGLPPQREREASEPGVSYHGYFQQRFYGWLAMMNYPAVEKVTLREYYHRRSETREATLHRHLLHHVEQELSALVQAFDRAVMAGKDSPLWSPSPGKHCQWCLKPGDCPIESEARGMGAIENEETANRYAAELVVAERVGKHRKEALKAWADAKGPVAVKDAKGRREFGFRKQVRTERPTLDQIEMAKLSGADPADLYVTKTSTRFGAYVPDGSDRAPDPVDDKLVEAMEEAAARIQNGKAKA